MTWIELRDAGQSDDHIYGLVSNHFKHESGRMIEGITYILDLIFVHGYVPAV